MDGDLGADEIARTARWRQKGRRFSPPPSGWTVFISRAVAAAAIDALAVPLLVSQKAACSGVRHLLLDVAKVVENGFGRGPVVNRVRASRAGAVTIGVASFISFSMVHSRRIHWHVLPTPALSMATPQSCSHCLCACAVSCIKEGHEFGVFTQLVGNAEYIVKLYGFFWDRYRAQ